MEKIKEEVRKVLESLQIYCGDCKWSGLLDTEDCGEGEEGYNHCDDCNRKQMNYCPDIDGIIEARYGKPEERK